MRKYILRTVIFLSICISGAAWPQDTGRVFGVLRSQEGGEETRAPGSAPQRLALPWNQISIYKGSYGVKHTPSGEILPGIVETKDALPYAVVTTNADGKFSLDLAPGTYTLFFDNAGVLAHVDGDYPQGDGKALWRTVEISENIAIDYNILMKKPGVTTFGLTIFSEVH